MVNEVTQAELRAVHKEEIVKRSINILFFKFHWIGRWGRDERTKGEEVVCNTGHLSCLKRLE